MRLVTINEYADLDRPAINWVVPQYIPRPSLIMLLGEPKVGKSFFALQIALAVARGEPVFGQTPRKGPVLYFQFDTSEAVWRDRFLKLREAGVNLDGDVLMVHPENNLRAVDIRKADVQDWWKRAIKLANPSLIIIDVLREIHNGNENDSTEMKIVGDVLMRLTHGYSTLLLHHTPKLKDEKDEDGNEKQIRVVNASRGSSYITGKCDAFWLLREHKLYVASRFGESFDTKSERLKNGFWRFPWLEVGGKLAALCDEFPALNHSQIADIAEERYGHLGVSRSNYYRWLSQAPSCVHTRPTKTVVSPSKVQGQPSPTRDTQASLPSNPSTPEPSLPQETAAPQDVSPLASASQARPVRLHAPETLLQSPEPDGFLEEEPPACASVFDDVAALQEHDV